MFKNIYLLIGGGLLAGIVLAAGAYYFGYQKGLAEGKEIGKNAAKTEAGAVVGNPLEKLPETNPFEKVINPFEGGYQNPFK
jgi:hypothetical protein